MHHKSCDLNSAHLLHFSSTHTHNCSTEMVDTLILIVGHLVLWSNRFMRRMLESPSLILVVHYVVPSYPICEAKQWGLVGVRNVGLCYDATPGL